MMVTYSRKEDLFNTISHVVGLVILSILVWPVIFISFRQGAYKKALAFGIYYLTNGMMFLASSLYHGAKKPDLRRALRVVDHCAIPICIAGTYTPIILLGFPGDPVARAIFIVVWVLALVAVGIDLYYGIKAKAKPKSMERVVMASYLVMGWLSLLLLKRLLDSFGWGFVIYLLMGGVFYTIGFVFYRKKSIPYNHAIWHVFIILACFSMYAGIYKYLK